MNNHFSDLLTLFVLAIPVACVAWTITHEEVFREIRERCAEKCKTCRHWYQRKFFYVFTCEYCLSHYVALGVLFLTGFKLLLGDWRGYVIAFFSLVWVGNQYMSLYNRLRVDIKTENLEGEIKESALKRTRDTDN